MPNPPVVYNLCWLSQPAGNNVQVGVTRDVVSTLGLQKKIGVAILYPSLATPEILGPDDTLELLVLTQSDADLKGRIFNQLKVSSGFDPKKQCANRGLFVGGDGQLIAPADECKIELQQIPFSPNDKLDTKSGRFAGYIDERAYNVFQKAGFTTLYRVSLSNKALAGAMGDTSLQAYPEPQDVLITSVLDKYHPTIKQWNKYCCFADGGDDLNFPVFDTDRPVQSWHPVFHYTGGLEYASLAHIADIHLAARQQVLANTTARVIEYGGSREQDTDQSPHIGSRINKCSKDMIDIFGQFDEADILLVGGDLVDCLRSCYLSEDIAPKVKNGRPKAIWDAVGLGKAYKVNYIDCVDMIAFYGLLVKFCGSQSKPAFLISGNHDCYLEPYGLSPRIGISEGTIWHRANEGIPADHNLTFYEAILAFGETYHELKSGLGSPFEAKTFEWFYTVFTPFTDYSAILPQQMLVACGWGDDENVIDPEEIGGVYGQGFGHLPRAPTAISDHQQVLIKAAIAQTKKVILMTHFTFVSYADSIPISQGNTDLGDVYCGWLKNYNERNMGTFERWRNEMFQTYLGEQRKVQVVLTGHSHRRALYLIQSVDTSGRTSVKTRHFDFDYFSRALAAGGQTPWASDDELEPAIIVSDSGGTIPRYNLDGEFSGWGSDSPSGTIILFDQGTGKVSQVKAAHALQTCKPRAAVALDYMDIQAGEDVIVRFETAWTPIDDLRQDTDLVFTVALHDEVSGKGIFIKGINLYLIESQTSFYKIVMRKSPSQPNATNTTPGGFAVQAADLPTFSRMQRHQKRGTFLAMHLGAAGVVVGDEEWAFDRYCFNDPWCFEFYVDFDIMPKSDSEFPVPPTHLKYIVKRSKSRAEFPDFDWRRTCLPSKYN